MISDFWGARAPNEVWSAVLMSVFRTLKQRGHDPIQTVVHAIEHDITTKQLPPLPAPKTTSDG